MKGPGNKRRDRSSIDVPRRHPLLDSEKKEFVTDEYHPVNTFQTKPSPKVHINLPKLHIQPFDGNPLQWLTFWDCYSNAVHNNIIMN